MSPRVNDLACIVGVGASKQGKVPDSSGDDLAVIAFHEALADAGAKPGAVDGLIVQKSFGGRGELRDVGSRLGLEPRVSFNVNSQCEALQLAVMAIVSGFATCIALVYGTNQRTNRNQFSNAPMHLGSNFERVYGLANPGSQAALNYRRRMFDYGATEEQLGAIAVAESRAAALNPLAVYRDRLSIEDYMASPYIIAPLRMCDFSMVSDGAFASIITSATVAGDFRGPPILINSIGYQSGFRELDRPDLIYQPSQRPNATRLWSNADFTQDDVDLLYVQDAYTPTVLSALENYGFCDAGTAHEWIQGGRIEIDGELPINVHGGQNRMTYMVGWQNTFDAVKQLRGEAQTAERQVPNCRVAMSTMSLGQGLETCSLLMHVT